MFKDLTYRQARAISGFSRVHERDVRLAWIVTIVSATLLALLSNALTQTFGRALAISTIGTALISEVYLRVFEGYIWSHDKFAGLAAAVMGAVGFAACCAVRVATALRSEATQDQR